MVRRTAMRLAAAQYDSQIQDRSYRNYCYVGYTLILIGLALMIVRWATLSSDSSLDGLFWGLLGVGIMIKIVGWICVGKGRALYRQQLVAIMARNNPNLYVVQAPGPGYGIPPPNNFQGSAMPGTTGVVPPPPPPYSINPNSANQQQPLGFEAPPPTYANATAQSPHPSAPNFATDFNTKNS